MSIINLKSDVSKSDIMEEEDVLKTKIALHKEGYYDVPKEYGLTPYSDERMFDGMKKFQKDKGLQIDGVMRTDGESVRTLDKSLEKHLSQNHEMDDHGPKPKCQPNEQALPQSTCIPGTTICYKTWKCYPNPVSHTILG